MQVDFGPLERAVKFWMDDLDSSNVKPTLREISKGWRIQLVDDGSSIDMGGAFYSQSFDQCVEWTDKYLKSWPDCRRSAWDMWDFKYRRDAEKFITLFHLSCPQ